MKDQEKDEIYSWALDLEHQLTFYQVSMLLRVVGEMAESYPESPVELYGLPEGKKTRLSSAPFVMPTNALMKLAQNRQLETLGLIEIYVNGDFIDYRATEKGEMVAEWMVASLENLKFMNLEMISVNDPESHLHD